MREAESYNPPDTALDALARLLYPAIRAYFDSEAGRREFAEWQVQQAAKHSPEEAEPDKQIVRAA